MVGKINSEHQTETMRNRQNIIGVAATCAVVFIATAVGANAQQDNAAFNAGVKAAQQDAQFIQGVQAAEGQGNAAEEARMNRLRDADGVTEQEYDDKNIMTKCFIVGRAPISTALSKATAVTIARKKAEQDAQSKFIKWMKMNVKVNASGELKAVEQERGSDNASGAVATKEAGADSSFGEVTSTSAEGFLRGMINKKTEIRSIDGDPNSKDKEVVSIYGWSRRSNDAASSAEASISAGAPRSDVSSAQSQAQEARQQTSGQLVPLGKPIEAIKSKKAGSSGINDF